MKAKSFEPKSKNGRLWDQFNTQLRDQFNSLLTANKLKRFPHLAESSSDSEEEEEVNLESDEPELSAEELLADGDIINK